MGDDVFFELHMPGAHIHIDNHRMRGVSPGDRGRLPVVGFLEPGINPLRTLMIPARTRCARHIGERHRHIGHADNTDASVAQLQVGGRALEHVCRDVEGLAAQALARNMYRTRQVYRGAAGDGAKTHRDGGGVGE